MLMTSCVDFGQEHAHLNFRRYERLIVSSLSNSSYLLIDSQKSLLQLSYLLLCQYNKVCHWLATGRWFSPVSFTNKIDCYEITEILLIVTLNYNPYPPNPRRSLETCTCTCTKTLVFFTLCTTSISYLITIKTSVTSELHKYNHDIAEIWQ
jgi:hypothetical protein